jgi:hypothetical protein
MQPQSVSQVLLSPLLGMYGPPQSCKRTIPLTGYGGRRGGFPHSEKTCRLNRSMQHWLKVHVQESTKLNSFKGVDVNGTLPCLGSD